MRTVLVFVLAAAFAFSPAALAANCAGASTGLVPLTDMSAPWLGQEGGLYPGGGNARPPAHAALGEAAAALILPRGPQGLPDPLGGRIVYLGIGMSNTRSEFAQFVSLAAADPARDPRVQVVNGAIGGWTAAEIADPQAAYWGMVDALLAGAGATPEQVQVVWLKEANAGPTGDPVQQAETLASQLDAIVDVMRERYPHLAIVYASSRIYAGYATTGLNPEPYAYASGFSVKRLVEERMALPLPWVSWGPYLWADGLAPRSDGLTWACAEFANDGTHPNAAGARKVAQMLLAHAHDDPTARAWYAS